MERGDGAGQRRCDRCLARRSSAARLADLASVFLTLKGEPRASKSQEKIDPAYPGDVGAVIACIEAANDFKAMLELAGWLAPALELGRRFAFAWRDAKEREGLID